MFFHLSFSCHLRLPMPSSSNHTKAHHSSRHIIIISLQNMPILSNPTHPGQSTKGFFQWKSISSWLLPNQFNCTRCCYHCFFSSSQKCHLILLQTPCLAPVRHCQSYTTVVSASLFLLQKLSSKKQPSTFSKFHLFDTCFCCSHCITSTANILSVPT